MPHVTGNYIETEQNQIAHLFLAVCSLCIGLATLCYTAANQATKHCILSVIILGYYCFIRFWNAAKALGTSVKTTYFPTLYKSKYLSLQHSICTQKQKTHIRKTTKHIFKQNDWATVEQHIGKLLRSTLGLFICLAEAVLLITNSFAMITCPRGQNEAIHCGCADRRWGTWRLWLASLWRFN